MASFHRYEQGGYGDDGLPDYIYYNGDVINNRTDDWDNTGAAYKNPLIQFNETRDAALVKDASKYHFSIVRFAMNGPSKAIPIFIPSIQSGPTQTNYGLTVATNDINLTTYGVAIPSLTSWGLSLNSAALYNVTFQITPPLSFMEFIPEFYNDVVAPLPNLPVQQQDINPASKYYNIYTYNSVVSMINNTFNDANYRLWYWLNQAFSAISGPTGANLPWIPIDGGTSGYLDAPAATPYWRVTISNIPAAGDYILAAQPDAPALTSYQSFIGSSGAATAEAPITVPPMLTFNPTTNLFTLAAPIQSGYGQNLTSYVAAGPNLALNTWPQTSLFVNNNMWGLIGNYPFRYINQPQYDLFGQGAVVNGKTIPLTLTEGYTYQMVLDNQSYSNIQTYNSNPNGIYPDGTSAYPAGTPNLTGQWYVCQQDFKTVDQLWSPVASIVFTTGLIPIRAEGTGAPVITGNSNTSLSAPTSQSAFQPIITDVVLPMTDGASDYNGFVYYAPQAEYRMSSMASSAGDIRSIDLQVFYRNRLNNTLYPISMFNLSNVSFKIMFRHRRLGAFVKSAN